MAATRPMAVVMRASEMPGATTARLAEPMRPMSPKAFMMPHTVPKRPMKGVTLAVVARKLSRRSSRVTSAVAARASERESDSMLRTVGFAPARAPCRGAAAHLLVQLEVARLEDAHERARLELRADRVHLGELAALAEDVEERLRLGVRAVQGDALIDDDGPREQGEEDEEDQDEPGHRARCGDQAADTPREARGCLGLGQQGEKEQWIPL